MNHPIRLLLPNCRWSYIYARDCTNIIILTNIIHTEMFIGSPLFHVAMEQRILYKLYMIIFDRLHKGRVYNSHDF